MTASAGRPVDSLTVDLGPRRYDVLVGEGLLARAGEHIAPLLAQPRVLIVTDETLEPLYLGALEESLNAAGIAHGAFVLPAGEQTKDFEHLQALIEGLIDLKVDRGTALVALGGGVIGDITGFAAAITLRGLDFVQIPTTLLAQVDSSVGGKTGINTTAGKNLVGAFHQPRLVLIDIDTLDTLPARELAAGYAEVVKVGLIGDADFFTWLEENGGALLEGDKAVRRHAILTSCAAKAAIVAEDERETGRRALLNLGHTFGHALEAQTGYGETLLHGEAVAIGMGLAFQLSSRLGLCASDGADRVRRHFEDMGLAMDLKDLADDTWSADGLLTHMGLDKKALGGRLAFVLVRGIGDAFVSRDVNLDEVRGLLKDALKA